MSRILIVESDVALAEKMSMSIMDNEAQVLGCGTVETASALLRREVYQIIIVDTELPDGDGRKLITDICRGCYLSGNASVIAILPNDREPDENQMSGLGVSDYITKPFNMAVLMTKIYTQLARKRKKFSFKASERFVATGSASRSSISGEHKVKIDSYVFDFDNDEYSVAGKRIELDLLEACTLRTLVENKGIVLKKRAFTEWLQCYSKMFVSEQLLADTIRSLNRKLGSNEHLKTIYGVGYMWASVE